REPAGLGQHPLPAHPGNAHPGRPRAVRAGRAAPLRGADVSRRPPAARAPVPLDPKRVRTVPLGRRPSKAGATALGKPVRARSSVREFLAGLPDILAARDLRDAATRIARALRTRRPVVLGMGAHAIKVGLGPLIVDLIERGRLAAVAMN